MSRLSSLIRRVIGFRADRQTIPTSDEKRAILLEIARNYECRAFLETGTFVGDTVAFMRPHFDTVVSIELSNELALRAQHRFEGDKGVRVIQGDSADVLKSLVPLLSVRTLFWLDGHYSHSCTVDGETLHTALGSEPTPVLKELDIILGEAHHDHVIVVDDARLFIGREGYPTVPEILSRVTAHGGSYETLCRDDMIIMLPRASYAG